ncbi:MAG: hypothetical protein ACOX5G_00205 [Kiritimatiellia bacterium]
MSSTITDVNGDYDLVGLSAGTYRIGFADDSSVHAVEYFNNVLSLDDATDIPVAEDEVVSGIDASLAPRPMSRGG